MKPALAVFMKGPAPGKCKTRLTPPLSPDEGAALYRAFCGDILKNLSTLSAHIRISYQPFVGFPTPAWVGSFPHFQQKGADLGERLIQAFDILFTEGYFPVVALGSDAPSLPLKRIAEAFLHLEKRDAVFGPAEDGGYYLVGLRRPLPSLFQNIPWSTENVMSATRKILADQEISHALLPPHYDVDTRAELNRLKEEIDDDPVLCPETRKVLRTLKIF